MPLSIFRFADRLRLVPLVGLVGWMTLLVAPEDVVAVPVDFSLALTVESVTCSLLGNPNPCPIISSSDPHFQALPKVGQTYYSSFSVQDDLLQKTGFNLPGTLTAFRLQIENLVWDSFNPGPSNVFAGFRGPIPGDPVCPGGTKFHICLYAPSPGFDVADGTITTIEGGVFGLGDIPFVDFEFGLRPHGFEALSGGIFVTGTFTISRVPEPSSLFLLVSGLALLVGSTLRWSRKHSLIRIPKRPGGRSMLLTNE